MLQIPLLLVQLENVATLNLFGSRRNSFQVLALYVFFPSTLLLSFNKIHIELQMTLLLHSPVFYWAGKKVNHGVTGQIVPLVKGVTMFSYVDAHRPNSLIQISLQWFGYTAYNVQKSDHTLLWK